MWLTLPAGLFGLHFCTKMFFKIHRKFLHERGRQWGPPPCTVSQAPITSYRFVLQSPRLSSRQLFLKNKSISQRVFWETMTIPIDIFAFILNTKWDDLSRLENTGLFKLNSKTLNLTTACFLCQIFFLLKNYAEFLQYRHLPI